MRGRASFGDVDHVDPDQNGAAFGAARSPSPARGRGNSREGFNSGRKSPLTIEGELVARSTGAASAFRVGDRVFHLKFGNGNVTVVDGNKLTVQFDKAGEKRVVDSFVKRV